MSRRDPGEASIYFDATKIRYMSSVELGKVAEGTRRRTKMYAKTRPRVTHPNSTRRTPQSLPTRL